MLWIKQEIKSSFYLFFEDNCNKNKNFEDKCNKNKILSLPSPPHGYILHYFTIIIIGLSHYILLLLYFHKINLHYFIKIIRSALEVRDKKEPPTLQEIRRLITTCDHCLHCKEHILFFDSYRWLSAQAVYTQQNCLWKLFMYLHAISSVP